MEFEQDWSVGLGATLRDRQKIKNYFSSFRDFFGKADSIILLGLECTIIPTKFNQNRWCHFLTKKNSHVI